MSGQDKEIDWTQLGQMYCENKEMGQVGGLYSQPPKGRMMMMMNIIER